MDENKNLILKRLKNEVLTVELIEHIQRRERENKL